MALGALFRIIARRVLGTPLVIGPMATDTSHGDTFVIPCFRSRVTRSTIQGLVKARQGKAGFGVLKNLIDRGPACLNMALGAIGPQSAFVRILVTGRASIFSGQSGQTPVVVAGQARRPGVGPEEGIARFFFVIKLEIGTHHIPPGGQMAGGTIFRKFPMGNQGRPGRGARLFPGDLRPPRGFPRRRSVVAGKKDIHREQSGSGHEGTHQCPFYIPFEFHSKSWQSRQVRGSGL